MQLNQYSAAGFDRGRPKWCEALWLVVQALLVRSFIPGSKLRVWLLRRFGARIADQVVVRPGLRVKFPWRLEVGECSWLGMDVWIDNLAMVRIGAHAVISQGAYLCTGSHDMRRDSFDLIVRPITIHDSAWVCAAAVIGPGTTVGAGAVVSLGSVATGELKPYTVYRGNPAVAVGGRDTSAAPR